MSDSILTTGDLAGTEGKDNMSGKRVLIVEDESVIAAGIAKKLENRGYDPVASVSSGEEAISTAEELQPDVVLMDVRIEGDMDGTAAAAEIRRRLDIPVVYLTAYSDQQTLSKAKLSEPYGYILKPFREQELYSVLEISIYRHEMEKRVRESEERYRTVSSVISDFAYSLIEDGTADDTGTMHFDWITDAVESITGYPKSSIATIADWTDLIVPADRELYEEFVEAGKTGRRSKVEYRISSANGSVKALRDQCQWQAGENGPGRLVGAVTDISHERALEKQAQESELKLSKLVEMMNEGLWLVDPSGRITYANDALAGILGYQRNELFTRELSELVDQEAWSDLSGRIATRERGMPLEIPLRHKDGSRKMCLVSHRPILGGDGTYKGSFGVVTDISSLHERRKAAERDRSLFQALFQANPDPAVVVREADRSIVDANESFLRETGYDRDDVVGYSTLMLANWSDLHDLNMLLQLFQPENTAAAPVLRIRTKGSVLKVYVTQIKHVVVEDTPLILVVLKDIEPETRIEE
jgi:PAS domain S-box-containing protein